MNHSAVFCEIPQVSQLNKLKKILNPLTSTQFRAVLS